MISGKINMKGVEHMIIQFYTTTNTSNKLNKTLIEVYSADFHTRDDIDLLSPTIITAQNSLLTGCNYAYIPEFNRYYFISNIVANTTNTVTISLTVDTLYTYKDIINKALVIANRNTTKYNRYLSDSKQPVMQNTIIQYKALPNMPFNSETISSNSKNFVLSLAKGRNT